MCKTNTNGRLSLFAVKISDETMVNISCQQTLRRLQDFLSSLNSSIPRLRPARACRGPQVRRERERERRRDADCAHVWLAGHSLAQNRERPQGLLHTALRGCHHNARWWRRRSRQRRRRWRLWRSAAAGRQQRWGLELAGCCARPGPGGPHGQPQRPRTGIGIVAGTGIAR